jgi:hypothetical protein
MSEVLALQLMSIAGGTELCEGTNSCTSTSGSTVCNSTTK